MSGPCVLLQYGDDPRSARFEDLEARPAFTLREIEQNPNLLLRLTREAHWAQQHPAIMGPDRAFFYFGPGPAPGYLVYGNGPTNPMAQAARQRREGSTSRYFTAQNGRDYKWRITLDRMECVDGRTVLAVWERSPADAAHHAQLTVKPAALAIVTEIVTTLTLNRIAQVLNW